MFRKKKNNHKLPLGVHLSFDLNVMTLEDMAKNGNILSIDDLSKTWHDFNCSRIQLGIVIVNSVEGNLLFFSGCNSSIYQDLNFDIQLPYPIGPEKTINVSISTAENLIFLSFQEIAIMAFPTSYIANLLKGQPLAEFNTHKQEIFGATSEINISISGPTGEYSLPLVSKVAKDWFKYENTAAKIMASVVGPKSAFPLNFQMVTD